MAECATTQKDADRLPVGEHQQRSAQVPADQYRKTSTTTYRPPMDMFDAGDRYEVRVDLPGSRADLIDVTLNDGVLTIEATVPNRWTEGAVALVGEYGIGNYRRQIRLGEDIDDDALQADYADGVLSISLPKRAEQTPRRIEIRSGDRA